MKVEKEKVEESDSQSKVKEMLSQLETNGIGQTKTNVDSDR